MKIVPQRRNNGVSDVIKLRGHFEMVLADLQGNVIEKRSINNVVVTAGRSWVLGQIISSNFVTSQSFTHMAIGTSTTAPATSDTALNSENSRKTINNFTTSGLANNPPSWRAEASWATNEANTTLGEVGVMNSSSGGTMLAHATFATLNKTTSNTLSISYTISN